MASNAGDLFTPRMPRGGWQQNVFTVNANRVVSGHRCANLKPETILIINSIVICSTTIYRPGTEFPPPDEM